MTSQGKAVKKLLVGFVIIEMFTLPIFRSGGRTQLTFVQWVKNHTIFGPPVEYVPEEDYARELMTPKEAADATAALS